MTANFLFPQVPKQIPRPDIGRGTMGGSVQSRTDLSATCDRPSGDSRNSFLNTLEQISKDNNYNKATRGTGGGELSVSAAHHSGDNFDASSPQVIGDTSEIFEATKQLEEDLAGVGCKLIHGSDLTVISSIFEKLGLYDSAGGSSSADKVDWILGSAEGLAALQLLLASPDQNDLNLSSEMKAVFDRLQQFIANENLLGELRDSRSAENTNLNQLVEKIVSGQENQRSSSGIHAKEIEFVKKSSNPLAKIDLINPKLSNENGQTGSLQPDANSQIAPRSENMDKTESIKLSAEARPGGIEASENAKAPRPLEAVRTEISELKDDPYTPVKAGAPNRASLDNRIPATIYTGKQVGGESAQQNLSDNESAQMIKMTNEARTARSLNQVQLSVAENVRDETANNKSLPALKMTNETQTARSLNQVQLSVGENVRDETVNNEPSPAIKMTNNTQAAKALDPVQRYGGEHVQNNMGNNELSPVSKMIHDAQMAKENQMRMDGATSDELGTKVTKVDAGANDNGLLNSQNQSAEKAFEATSPSKQTDNSGQSLRTHTLDQIVRRAVIFMRNGQHEAKIDLKPEYLGHVRMQVTTENHQVTVKILTEFGFVKDMVENNIHQLKADLQQQGLNVDKLEVAVSDDSDEHNHPQGKAAQAKDRHSRAARINPESPEGETREQSGNVVSRKAGPTTVDYFA